MKKVKLKWKKAVLKPSKNVIGSPMSKTKKIETIKKLDKNAK